MKPRLNQRLVFVALFCSIYVVPLSAQSLNMRDYIDALRSNDHEYKQLLIKEKQIAYIKDSEIDEKALLLNLEAEKGYGDDDVDTSAISAELLKQFIDSGTSVSLSHREIENTDSNQSLSELELEQSLLKNSFGKAGRLHKNKLEMQEERDALLSLNAFETYLLNRLTLYLEYGELQQQEDFLKDMLKKSRDLHHYIQEKRSKFAANELDELRVKLQLLEREQELRDIRKKRKDAEVLLLKGTGMVSSTMAVDEAIVQVDDVIDIRKNLSSDIESFDLKQFRDYQIALLENAIGDTSYKLAKDEERPELSVFGAYKTDDSTRFSNSVNRSETSFGLKLSLPVGDKKSKATSEIMKLESQYQGLQEKLLADTLANHYMTLSVELKEKETKLETYRQKVQLVKAIIAKESLRYERGLIDIEHVINSYNDLYEYQFEYQQERVAFNVLFLQWLDFNDRLLAAVISEVE